MTRDLFVNEVFGPTLQGEGPSIGQPAVFLRMAGCNLSCVWCDTPYSWDYTRYDKAAEVHRMTVEQVAQTVAAHAPSTPEPLLVLTGGEPLLQQAAIVDLVATDADGPVYRLEVETAGTIGPTDAFADLVTLFVVSPKLEHSGNDRDKRLRPEALARLNEVGRVAWKFVVQTVDQLDEVAALVDGFDLEGPVYIMPEGFTREGLAQRGAELADAVVARGWRFTPRLHVMLWGTTRGV